MISISITMAKDIFDIDNIDSSIRRIVKEKGFVDLKDIELESFTIPENYQTKQFSLPEKKYDNVINKQIRKVQKVASENGFNHQKVNTVLFEAVRNAHQHGNKLDPNKKITIAYNIVPGKYDFIIVDQGGVLNPKFISYMQRYKQGLHREKPISFYDFANQKNGTDNLGRGILLIHSYADKVSYYKSPDNGLMLHVQKSKIFSV